MTDTAKFLVSTCIVPCNDLPKARDFYVDLGFEVRHEQADYVILRKDAVSLHVTFSEGWYIDPKLNNTQIRIETDNVDALYAKCRELDIVPSQRPSGTEAVGFEGVHDLGSGQCLHRVLPGDGMMCQVQGLACHVCQRPVDRWLFGAPPRHSRV